MTLKTNLSLGKIVLKNYKGFKETSTIELSRNPEKSITVIVGDNGVGKTNILNAIYWCLYGNSWTTKYYGDEGIINRHTLFGLKLGDADDMCVEVHLYEENKLCYKLKRNIHFVKKQEFTSLVDYKGIDGYIAAGIEITTTVEFSYLQKSSGFSEWQKCTDPMQIRDSISSLFPESLSSYLFVGDDLIGRFICSDAKNIVKNGIEKTFELQVLDEAIKRIKQAHTAIPSEEKNDMSSLESESRNRELGKDEPEHLSHCNQIDFTNNIERILKQCRGDIMDQFRSMIAKKTTDYFLPLAPGRNYYNVEINSDYALTVYDPAGHSMSLAATQSYCLGLSYITAMREVLGKNYFIMIDSILGRMDQKVKLNVIKSLLKHMSGTQLILMLSNSEYNVGGFVIEGSESVSSVRDMLKESGKLWKAYKLIHVPSETNSNTLVEEIKD